MWNPEGQKILSYLKDKRHISEDTLKKFKVGYCPREENYFLSGRVFMPICDARGEVIAFSTRDFEAEKQYQHWHESFDKSSHLYGLDVARKHIQWNDKVIIVEGQFDTMCLHSYGLPMTVGLCGTSISLKQIVKLARYCSEFYFVLDDDDAGEKCFSKAMKIYREQLLMKMGISFISVKLPNKLDPDEFVYNFGKDEFVNLLNKRREEVLYGTAFAA